MDKYTNIHAHHRTTDRLICVCVCLFEYVVEIGSAMVNAFFLCFSFYLCLAVDAVFDGNSIERGPKPYVTCILLCYAVLCYGWAHLHKWIYTYEWVWLYLYVVQPKIHLVGNEKHMHTYAPTKNHSFAHEALHLAIRLVLRLCYIIICMSPWACV